MNGQGEHYFSAQPATAAQRRTIDVAIAGRSVRLSTASGVFSADHLDHATKILLDVVPPPPATGTLLDLGCGWGPIAVTMAALAPKATVVAVDVNERALELTRENAAELGADQVTAYLPDEVPADLTFDAIWSNPPIRIGKAALHELLRRWLPRLSEHGRAYLVVAKNLGADSLAGWIQDELGFAVERIASVKGFRVLAVEHASVQGS